MEASVNSLIGVSGCLYAVRRELFPVIASDMISDFVIVGELFEKGYVTAYSHGAVAIEKTLEDTRQEFDMRVRVAIRSINALIRYARMLNPVKYRLYSIQLISHKVLRYLVPEFMIALLVVHIALVVEGTSAFPYGLLLAAHLSIYGIATLGWIANEVGVRIPGLHIPFYFMQVNLAALWALICYMRGARKTIWTPIR